MSTDELELVADGGATPLKISADGSTIFYNRFFTLFANRPDESTGENESTAITPLAIPGDILFQRVASAAPTARALRISEDGSEAIFVSEVQTPGFGQVFRWDVESGLTRISSLPNGDPVDKSVTFGNYADLAARTEIYEFDVHGQWGNTGRVWTDDHDTVFFQTPAALTGDDHNTVMDVYEWRDGEVTLVTPGTPGSAGFYYFASSADGSTVFFHTLARVLPDGDRNPVRDIYAARVGGGFPPLPPDTVGDPPPPSGPADVPAAFRPDTEAPRPGVTPKPGGRGSLAVGKLPSGVTRGLARRGRVGVNVRLGGAGQVTVRATASIGGKRRAVGRTSKRVRGGGSTRIVLRISKAARAQLGRTRRLAVTLAVSGGGAAKRVTVVLRLPAADQSKRG